MIRYLILLSIVLLTIQDIPESELLERVPIGVEGRSSKWTKVRNQHIARHPKCELCGSTNNLHVHHIFPVHIAPELELETRNLVTLCEKHHLERGHLGNWKKYNTNILLEISKANISKDQ